MRQILGMAIATALALSASGCDVFDGGDDTATPPESPSPVVISPSVAPASPSPSPGANGTQTPTVTLPRDLDLIRSTDPDQRVQSVQSNRSDPFALIPTTPTVEFPPSPSPVAQAPAPGSDIPGGGVAPGSDVPNQPPGGLAPIPNLVPSAPSSPVAILPPPPQPNLARAVAVLGVVQIGDTVYAIVDAPNEPSSRYVREGQRLSNGQVLVRRIEMNAGAEPVVVFEQYGIEVVTAVGEGGIPETQPSPAASVPVTNSRQSG
ncbi:MAG: hypothetical protein HC769_36135 [Cyanobacteria bacterium CRU_2_1]|nr:hypothetical protein [Cyanobacteria bacterium RU_5_0]NJR63729.1 hypothetical protein [Cyanobacteria bacterium CRU_2_1]